MKILVVHNSYQQAGGEDTVVKSEIGLLRQYGHEVLEYRRNNVEIQDQSRAKTALSTIWSSQSDKDVKLLCERFRPELIHAHNTFPLISPSLYWLATRLHIPIIQTLHNFRLICPQAMLLRDGAVCEDCVGKFPWRAVTRACYHDSRLQSAVVTSMLGVHRFIGTYQHRVSAYIAMNHFCRNKFIAGGLPEEKIHIKPNFVDNKRLPDWKARSDGVYVGRLSEEKGIHTLLAAKKILTNSMMRHGETVPTSIKVIGTGPLGKEVAEAFSSDYLGSQEPEAIFELLHKSSFLVAPSTCYETFGLAAAEAFSCGVPVIASQHGGLAELVTDGVNGLLFEPGNANELAQKIAWATNHPDQMLGMGRAAYEEYQNKYTPEQNYASLMTIYQNALTTMGEQYADRTLFSIRGEN